MTNRIDKLRTLLQLRHRDVDRRTRDVAEAVDKVDAAERAREHAEMQVAQAARRHDAALSDRTASPCDPLVAMFCQTTEAALAYGHECFASAEKVLHQALRDASEKRQLLLRAQVRSDVLETSLSRALQHRRRAADKRLGDDCINDFRPVTAMALA